MIYIPSLIVDTIFVFIVYQINKRKFKDFNFWGKLREIIVYYLIGAVIILAIGYLMILWDRHVAK